MFGLLRKGRAGRVVIHQYVEVPVLITLDVCIESNFVASPSWTWPCTCAAEPRGYQAGERLGGYLRRTLAGAGPEHAL